MSQKSKVSRVRLIGYKYSNQVTVRLGKYENAMLNKLTEFWSCSSSEAIRRCIVYTFSKMVAKVDVLDEEGLTKALIIALKGLSE